ncbi:MAG: hypothetical protein V4560_02935 [Bacteroidota bacterium]
MKRNLLKGIILISAVALSSCSTVNNLSKTKILDDDVYYTKSQAGDSYEPVAYVQPQNNYVRNDDYYYYGDYESRINRFNYFTPFDYDDDFYYDYTPYYAYSNNSLPVAQPDGYYDDPVYSDLGVYSAYDFGYGYYDGYDNFGYGVAYSTFIYGGGSRANYKRSRSHYSKGNNATVGFVLGGGNTGAFSGSRPNNSSVVNNGLTFSRPNNGTNNNGAFNGNRPGGNNAVYPGRPGSNAQAVINPNVVPRYVRPESQNPRQVVQQPAIERVNSSPPPSSNNNSSSSGSSSSGSSSSSGGGGRPVRP